MFSSHMPPINITNVLTAQSPRPSLPVLQVESPASIPLSTPAVTSRLDISGQRGVAVKEYSD